MVHTVEFFGKPTYARGRSCVYQSKPPGRRRYKAGCCLVCPTRTTDLTSLCNVLCAFFQTLVVANASNCCRISTYIQQYIYGGSRRISMPEFGVYVDQPFICSKLNMWLYFSTPGVTYVCPACAFPICAYKKCDHVAPRSSRERFYCCCALSRQTLSLRGKCSLQHQRYSV